MNFSKNLKALMRSKKMTAQSIADKLGVTRATVTHWSNGIRLPTSKQIERLASVLQCPVAELFGEKQNVKTIPLIGVASCGVPTLSYDDALSYIPVPQELAREGVYAVTADGESMLPRIKPGDIVLCDQQMECINGNIVHYTTLDGESGLKVYQYDPKSDTVTLYPLNPNGHAPLFVPRDELRCARAFKIMSDL